MLHFLGIQKSNFYRWKHKDSAYYAGESLVSEDSQEAVRLLLPDKRVIKADLIIRQIRAKKPNQKWYTDVSVILKGERPLNLSTIIDGCNNEVISNVFSTSPDIKVAFDTVECAIQQRSAEGVVLHSDQGGLYIHRQDFKPT